MSLTHKIVQTKLTKGLLDLIILQLVDTHPMHGYELIVTIRKIYGVSFGASTIYPLLGTMEKKKLIKCEWNTNGERPKKVYELTSQGKCLLDYTTGSLRVICQIIEREKMKGPDEHLQLKVEQSPKTNEEFPFSNSKFF